MSSCALSVSSSVKQVWVAVGVLSSVVAQGVVVGYSSPLLAELRARGGFQLDLHRASLLSSILGPAVLVGQITSGVLMDVIGRRSTFLVAQIPGVVGWLLIYFCQSYSVLLTGRLFTGVSTGLVSMLSVVVLGEYTDPKQRGVYLSLKMACFNLGFTISHNVLGLLYWRTIALVAVVPYVVTAVVFYTSPESPAWLATKQKYDKCRNNFFLIRRRTGRSIWEVEEMIAAQKEQQSLVIKNSTIFQKLMCYFKKFTQKDFLKPLVLLVFSIVQLEACGRHFFSAYAANIMSDITGPGADYNKYIVIIDVLTTVAAFAAVPLMRVMNRRTLLFSSGVSSLLALFPTCIFLYLISNERLSRDYQLVPISLLSLYFFLVNIGCSAVTMAVKGELFPVRHRGAALVSGAFILFILLSISFHFTLFSLFYLNVYGTFALCGVIMASTLVGMYVMLPETKDRTLQEVEDYFHNGRYGVTRLAREDHLTIITQKDG
ncbi:facilitated trehalose transporter Tret1-like [Plodia interpunctella]|uniref:facilitated trehalose transporter Tret1-like n=1 Tax=Plodia interpunctella TaxID=58824 RepID=UPI002367EC81|nr:facilitated trehalose transporter Tret1-like [Plodia interpunctella]